MERKYIIVPCKIGAHLISVDRLIRLYGVHPDECIIYDPQKMHASSLPKDLTVFHPREDGNYELPEDEGGET